VTESFVSQSVICQVIIIIICSLGRPLSKFPVFLVAATLRPETMYGQTNCWVRPDMAYVACLTKQGEIIVSTERSARNMAYQGFFEKDGVPNVQLRIIGQVKKKKKKKKKKKITLLVRKT
jgi:leucyl-tRNA synthetase